MKYHSFQTIIITGLLLISTKTFSQDISGEIDKIFSWATPDVPGCVCAVSQNGKLIHHRAYGSADLERNVPLTTESVLDIGSVSKQFVAAATLILVEEGKLALTDDIRKYIPELPDYGHVITVDHLLTHTSGLRDWTGIIQFEDGESDAFTMALRQRALNFTPGEAWSYSNTGFVLAKEIVSRVSGMSFGEFSRKRLFEPLGMTSTSYRHNMLEVVKNRALAYQKNGDEWHMEMLLDNDRGGGGILSTANDLLVWNDVLTHGKLGSFITSKIQEPARLNNGRELGYARGLMLEENRGGKLVWHSGSAAAYKTLLGRFTDLGLSISIVCNSGDGTDRTAFAMRIFDLLIPAGNHKVVEPKGPPPVFAEGVDTTGFNMVSRAGLYFNENGESFRLSWQDGRLRIANGPALVAQSRDHFRRWGAKLEFMSQDAFELKFLSANEFEYKSMEGKTTTYRRALPYAPTQDELKAFTGAYESDELSCVFRIDTGNGVIKMWVEHKGDRHLDFKPVAPDTFEWGRMMVRFNRNKEGIIESLNYSNPVLSNVRFKKMNKEQ